MSFGHFSDVRKSGFTLIELMVVIALLAFLGMLGANVLMSAEGWLAEYRLRNAASDLYANLQKCRIRAVKDNKDWAIVFDTGSGRYLICSDKGADNSWSNTADNQVTETVVLADYKGGVRYGHGAATTAAKSSGGSFPADGVSYHPEVAVFNPRGFASTYGFVYLCNQINSSYAVGATTSGLIKIRKWSGTGWQ